MGDGDGESAGTRSEAGFFCPAYVGLRCLLLLVVLEGHYWFEVYPDPRLTPLTFAVPCFFALSGYLISHTLFRYESRPHREALTIFYLRRAFRILPPFYLVLAVAHLVGGTPYLVWQACYLMNIKIYHLSQYEPYAFMAYLQLENFNAMHFWSVSVEEQFYLLYPLFLFGLGPRFRTLLLSLGIGATILARLWYLQHQPHAFYGGLSWVAGEFILWACLLAWLEKQGRLRWLGNRLALYASLLAFILLSYHDRSYGVWAQWKPPAHQTVYAVLLAVLVLSLRHCPDSALSRALSWRVLAPIGAMSYGAYLVHIFLNPVADRLAQLAPWLVLFPQCPRATVGPLVTLAVASVMWYGFEQPINKLRRRWSSDSV